MTRHLYPFSDERSYFFDSLYDHNRLCHGSKTFFREPNKDEAKLESMFTIIQVLRISAVGNAWCIGPLCAGCAFICASKSGSSVHQVTASKSSFREVVCVCFCWTNEAKVKKVHHIRHTSDLLTHLTVMMVQVNRYTDMPEVFMRGNMLWRFAVDSDVL